MDIVGYSKLPIDEQEKLLLHLQDAVRQTSEFSRAQSSNELIRLPTGDGMALVFFRDAESPVRCALELSRSLRSQPALELRMGIHSGPVYRVADINANQNVAGGGINVAQRVMDCGDAGHILVSEEVAKVLNELSAWKGTLRDLGEMEVKHAVRVHLFNLFTEDAGNPAPPLRLSAAAARARAAKSTRRIKFAISIASIIILGFATLGWLYRARRAHALSTTDTVVLADFTNTTGDPVFDGALRQGLAVQLEQSPFLSLISEQRIQQTLRLMNQSPDARLTSEIARDICQRQGSAAVIGGSIAQIGTQYSLIVKAVDCSNGETLASAQSLASDKNRVLGALGKVATDMRSKLGESLNSVRKLDTPLEQATTPSLDALQAYSLGRKMQSAKADYAGAMPFFQRSIQMDPDFAMAYAALGTSYFNLGEFKQAVENTRKAYALRERVSEREKFYIEAHYSQYVSGDLEKARQALDLWAQTYPRDSTPSTNLWTVYASLGQYEKVLEVARKAQDINPNGQTYANVVLAYASLNRLADAQASAKLALANSLDSPNLRFALYQVAFLQNSPSEMARQVAWSAGKPAVEDVLLAGESDTAAYSGRLASAREFSRQAMASAEHAGEKETAAEYAAAAALQEALFGNINQARERVQEALARSNGRDVQNAAALALAFAGDALRAQSLADDLDRRLPEDTLAQFNYLPTIRAQLLLIRHDPAKAIASLQIAAPYESGISGNGTLTAALYPVYVRALAFLAAQQGREAAAEFQKILDQPGVAFNSPIGALAHLGLGRACAMQGDSAKARAAYNDFFTLWKDADPDIPILVSAKSEFAKLK
jgi:eukaryotic-like serine/threonine-protein kinase